MLKLGGTLFFMFDYLVIDYQRALEDYLVINYQWAPENIFFCIFFVLRIILWVLIRIAFPFSLFCILTSIAIQFCAKNDNSKMS